jgi:hypothetical protein
MSIFALIAAVLFFLRAFGVEFDSVDMTSLALGFLALHFAYSWSVPIRRRNT